MPDHPVISALMRDGELGPACGSTNCEYARQCNKCGTNISDSQARFGLCPDCEIEAEVRFENLLATHFTKDELSYLNNQYDGRCFGHGK